MSIILIDMDGTIVDLMGELQSLCEWTDPGSVHHPVCKWDFYDCCIDKTVATENMQGPLLFETALPILGVIEGVQKIQAHHDTWFVTTPCGPNSAKSKYNWIEEFFPGQSSRVIMTYDKSLVHGRFLLDDKPPELVEKTITPSWLQLVYPQPWNTESVGRVCTWEDGLADTILDLCK